MAESNGLIAAKGSTILKCSPVNYGVNHARWDRPNDYLPWTKLRLVRKYGGYPQHETDGATLYEASSTAAFVVPSAVASATGFNYQGSFSGGGVGYVGDGNGLAGVSFSGGGSITDPNGALSGPISTFSRTSGTNVYGGGGGSFSATGGSGSGAKIKFTVQGYLGDGLFAVELTVDTAGTGYKVGDVLTIPSSSLPVGSDTFVIQVTAITTASTPATVSYTVTPSTSTGGGSGASVRVTRSGYLGQPGWTVSSVDVISEGGGYAIGNTLTVSSSLIGGTANGATTLTLTVTSIISSGISTVAYFNVASTSGGTGSGATFDVYRTGPAGSYSNVTNVVQRNAGSGYATTGAAVTIAASVIGGTTGGALTLNLNSGTVVSTGGTISSVVYTQSAIRALASWSDTAIASTGGTILSEASKTYTNVPLYTALGSGTGAIATITRNSSGIINGVTITSPGNGYIVGDLLIAPAEFIGGDTAKSDQFGDSSYYHVYDDGVRTFSSSPAAYTTQPEPGYTSAALKGKEVFYAVYAQYPTSGSTEAWINLSKTSTVSVKDTGMLDYLKQHLPATYFNDNETDLSDFLSLFAFHLELYKSEATHVFTMTDAQLTDASLLRGFLSQIGVKFEDVQDVSMGRQVMDNFGAILTQKGSIAGIKQLIKSYTGYDVTITNGINLLPGINTSSFEQDAGWWTQGIYATSATDATKLGVGVAFALATSATGVTPFTSTSAANAQSGMAAVFLLAPASGGSTSSLGVGPKRAVITGKSTTVINGVTYDTLTINANEPAVGDYVVTPLDYATVSTSPNAALSVIPGTRVKSRISNLVFSLDTRIGSGSNADVGDEVWFSKTAIDRQGTSTAFIPVIQNVPYAFSTYVNHGTSTSTISTVTANILWRDISGSIIGTTPSVGIPLTNTTTAQPVSTWSRATVSGLPPATAVYAEPVLQLTPPTTSGSYYIDAAMVNQGVAISRRARSSTTATITTAAAHGFTSGAQVTVSGVGGTNNPFDGTYAITGVTSTTFTYTTTSSGTIASATSTGLAASARPYEDARKVTLTLNTSGTTDTADMIASKKARLETTLADNLTLTQTKVNTQGAALTATVTSATRYPTPNRKKPSLTVVNAVSNGSTIVYTVLEDFDFFSSVFMQVQGATPAGYNYAYVVANANYTNKTITVTSTATPGAYVSGGVLSLLSGAETLFTTQLSHSFEVGQTVNVGTNPGASANPIVCVPSSTSFITESNVTAAPSSTSGVTVTAVVDNGVSNNYVIQ